MGAFLFVAAIYLPFQLLTVWRFRLSRALVKALDRGQVAIGDLSEGFAVVKGKVLAEEDVLYEPLKGRDCLYYQFRVFYTDKNGLKRYVVDDCQRVACTIRDASAAVELIHGDGLAGVLSGREASGRTDKSVQKVVAERYPTQLKNDFFTSADWKYSYSLTWCRPDKMVVLGRFDGERFHVVSAKSDFDELHADQTAELGVYGLAAVVVCALFGAYLWVEGAFLLSLLGL